MYIIAPLWHYRYGFCIEPPAILRLPDDPVVVQCIEFSFLRDISFPPNRRARTIYGTPILYRGPGHNNNNALLLQTCDEQNRSALFVLNSKKKKLIVERTFPGAIE